MHLTTRRPGHRKGTANPISSSLAYSLHENQCGSDCAVKNRAPRPGKAAKTFGDAGPKQDASAAGVVDYYRLSLLAWLASRWKPDVLS